MRGAKRGNLSETQRACQQVQLECRYLVKDLEVEMKEELLQLATEVDGKLNAMTLATVHQEGRDGGSAGELATTDHSHVVSVLSSRIETIRDDLQSQLRAVERKMDTRTKAFERKYTNALKLQREQIDDLETSVSTQMQGMAEDTQHAFAAAFAKYNGLDQKFIKLQRQHNELLKTVQSKALQVPIADDVDVPEKGSRHGIRNDEPSPPPPLPHATSPPPPPPTPPASPPSSPPSSPPPSPPPSPPALSPTTKSTKQSLKQSPKKSEKKDKKDKKDKNKKEKKEKKKKGRRYKGPAMDSSVSIPTSSVGQYMLMGIRNFGNGKALVEASDPEMSMTFRTVINQVKACAIGLLFCGMSDKSVILVALPSVPRVPVVALAIALIGATCVPVSPDIFSENGKEREQVLARLQTDIGASGLFIANNTTQCSSLSNYFQLIITVAISEQDNDATTTTKTTEATKKSTKMHTYDELLALGRTNSKQVPPPARVNGAKSIGFMVPSQRCPSTLDRLVGLTHQAVVSILINIVNAKEFNTTDIVAVAVPFWDARALFGAVLPALLSGACVVCPGALHKDTETLLMLLTSHGVTQLWVHASNARHIAKHHNASSEAPLGAMLLQLKRICCVEAASSHVLQQCAEACSGRVHVCVNSCPIEMGGRICSPRAALPVTQGTITKTLPLLPGIECKILHPGTRKMCAPGKRGIVCLKGGSMMAGKKYASTADSRCL